MENISILTADLYENEQTEKPSDFKARPQITGIVRNTNIADDIGKEFTGCRKETILNILDQADQKKLEAIIQGKCLIDGLGQYTLNLSGPLEGENPYFDPHIHKIGIMFTPGKRLLSSLKLIVFNFRVFMSGPIIDSVTDTTTRSVNDLLTSFGPAVISGNGLLLKGSHPSIGVYLTEDREDAKPCKVNLIVTNSVSQIVIQVPRLMPGQYRLSVITQSGFRHKSLKEPHIYEFPIVLTIHENERDNYG